MRTIHPGAYLHPIDRDARPRRYAPEFAAHEAAVDWQRAIAAEHYARFGMRHGCRHTSAGRAGGDAKT